MYTSSDAQKKRGKILASLSPLQRANLTPSDARKMKSGATTCAGASWCPNHKIYFHRDSSPLAPSSIFDSISVALERQGKGPTRRRWQSSAKMMRLACAGTGSSSLGLACSPRTGSALSLHRNDKICGPWWCVWEWGESGGVLESGASVA
jgi:hypothetical protein